jgi:hypothetical protein
VPIRRHILPALAIALTALLLLAPVAPAAAKGNVALSASQRSATARASVGSAHDLGQAKRCAKRIPAARVSRMGRQQRRRVTRRLRKNCRPASVSTAPGLPVYWGATIGDQLTGEQAPWDMDAVSKFEETAGKKVSLVNFFSPFAECSSKCSFYKFPVDPMENIREHGSIPVFSWSSQSIPSSLNEPDFQLADVINGSYDSYIREFAEDARDWGHPFFLRFNWEMNGDWFPWMEGVNSNQTGESVAAWRHVHDIFTSVGATNVSWVWCPNVDPGNKMRSLASLYPGDEYVDWTGLDGYNWGPAKGGWTSFKSLYSSTYRAITGTIAPSKPMMIGEMGSSEKGGSKASWISETLAEIPSEFPQIRGVLWFDTFDDGMDWPIESSDSASSAFASGIQNASYRTNTYADLAPGPIPPPS